jgi:hypothetical protein
MVGGDMNIKTGLGDAVIETAICRITIEPVKYTVGFRFQEITIETVSKPDSVMVNNRGDKLPVRVVVYSNSEQGKT